MQMDLLTAEPETGTDRTIHEMLDQWLPPDSRVVRHGSLLREIELVEDRFLRVELAAILADLPEDRFRWLEFFVAGARNNWPHARLAISADRTAAFAEADLECSSPETLRDSLPVAVHSLRWLVVALAETAEFLADPASTCEALNRKQFLPEAEFSAGRQNQKPNKK
ncbi:MAG: hypothetical protein HKN23_07495 [Verrucomicrobiales bacterium]|nr:hypothetical protein [Verrucomicrobiales bacterium]